EQGMRHPQAGHQGIAELGVFCPLWHAYWLALLARLPPRIELRWTRPKLCAKVAVAMCQRPMISPLELVMTDYTPYQQKIIKRYYNYLDIIQRQRLAELVSELYLAEGKKRQKVWQAAAAAMQKLGVPQARIDHLVQKNNPALIAEVVKELEAK